MSRLRPAGSSNVSEPVGEAGPEEFELDVHGAGSESCQAEVPERTAGAHQ